MRRAIYPGSFDPVTNGHLDVIERARKLFDEVDRRCGAQRREAAAFLAGGAPRFAARDSGQNRQRANRAVRRACLSSSPGKQKPDAVIRGLRAVSDFEFEFQMALMNRKLDCAVETIFLMPKEEYTYLSSRMVKEIARLGGDVSSFVPACVAKALEKKFSE